MKKASLLGGEGQGRLAQMLEMMGCSMELWLFSTGRLCCDQELQLIDKNS